MRLLLAALVMLGLVACPAEPPRPAPARETYKPKAPGPSNCRPSAAADIRVFPGTGERGLHSQRITFQFSSECRRSVDVLVDGALYDLSDPRALGKPSTAPSPLLIDGTTERIVWIPRYERHVVELRQTRGGGRIFGVRESFRTLPPPPRCDGTFESRDKAIMIMCPEDWYVARQESGQGTVSASLSTWRYPPIGGDDIHPGFWAVRLQRSPVEGVRTVKQELRDCRRGHMEAKKILRCERVHIDGHDWAWIEGIDSRNVQWMSMFTRSRPWAFWISGRADPGRGERRGLSIVREMLRSVDIEPGAS